MSRASIDLASKLSQFYDDHVDEMDPYRLGRAYAEYFLTNGLATEPSLHGSHGRPFDVAIVCPKADLADVTKRSMLISERLVISQNDPDARNNLTTIRTPAARSVFWNHTETRIEGIKFKDLGRFLRSSEPLSRQARVVYVPNIVKEEALLEREVGLSDYFSFEKTLHIVSPDLLGLVESEKLLIDIAPRAFVGSHLVRPLVATEIPYIEGTSLRDLSEMAMEELGAFTTLQQHLRGQLLAMEEFRTQQDIDHAGARLVNDVHIAVRGIESDLRRVLRRSSVQAAGAVLATCTAILVAVQPSVVATVSALGAGGGVWGLVLAAQEYMDRRGEISDSPFYFLWLLEKRQRSQG